MTRTADLLYARLLKLDPAAERYDDMVGLCPYNDYCKVANALMTQYYFDDTLNLESAFDDIVKKKPGRGEVFHVGMRVVFNENRKIGQDGVYARGQVGKVMCILSSAGKRGNFTFPDRNALSDAWMKESKKATSAVGGRDFGSMYVRLTDTGEMVRLEFQGSRGLGDVSVAHFITCDRSQGLEYVYTLVLCPWGNNLATADVLYTMITRPQMVGSLIGQKSHLKKMIETPPEVKMTQFLDYYSN